MEGFKNLKIEVFKCIVLIFEKINIKDENAELVGKLVF